MESKVKGGAMKDTHIHIGQVGRQAPSAPQTAARFFEVLLRMKFREIYPSVWREGGKL
jgi:hypothetical protein